MVLVQTETGFDLYKEKARVGWCALTRAGGETAFTGLWIAPEWRRRGYGSYLLRQVLHRCGATAGNRPAFSPRPCPPGEGGGGLLGQVRLCPRGGPPGPPPQAGPDRRPPGPGLSRRPSGPPPPAGGRHLRQRRGHRFPLPPGRGGGPGPRLRHPARALDATRARLAREGVPADRCRLILDSHANLLRYVQPGSADGVVFNFGWLPGADHTVHSEAGTSIPALEAALTALRPGGVLSAVLYSGAVIGDAEKRAVLAWLEGLPLTGYTVLACRFANWRTPRRCPAL